jgi:hypothetical protein
MHHAEPEVSLHVHFANADLARDLQFDDNNSPTLLSS